MTRDQQTGLYARFLGRFIGLAESAEMFRKALPDERYVDRMIGILHDYQAEETKLNAPLPICGDLPTLKAMEGK